MRVMLIYPPLRSQADRFLPLGCLTIANALKEIGTDVQILNVDVERISDEEIVEAVTKYDPMIVGYSAVTSTTYAFIKRITKLISQSLNKKIYFIVGGNITVSSDILIEKCGIDTCFIGEGYSSIKEYVLSYNVSKREIDAHALLKIRGLVFKHGGKVHFTGKQKLLMLNEIPLPRNLDIIDTDYYFPFIRELGTKHYSDDIQKRIMSLPKNARCANIMVGSGCQNACSFCHRNVPGYRQREIAVIFDYIDYLIERYNIRMFAFCDESLFAKESWVVSFTEEISKRNIVFQIAGIRADMVVKYKDILSQLAKVGLISVEVGLESGSQQMLDVMDKRIKIEDNYRAIEIINALGLYHTPQIIFGMPGETPKDIKETAKMLRTCRSSNGFVSINIAQVLPGTPLYWFALKRGLIINEEDYLIQISDRNASQLEGTINVTEYPHSMFILARDKIAMMSMLSYGNISMCLRYVAHYLFVLIKTLSRRHSVSLKEKIALVLYALSGRTFKVRRCGFSAGSLRKMMLEEDSVILKEDSIKCMKYGSLPS